MNEIDFLIKCARDHVIIILITKKPWSRMTDSDNREYIIFIEIINVVDDIILFFFSFLKNLLSHIVWLSTIFIE